MKTEEVKKLAKEKYGKVLTDEEAEALLERLNAEGELSEDDLESVAGGIGHAFGEWYAGKRLL